MMIQIFLLNFFDPNVIFINVFMMIYYHLLFVKWQKFSALIVDIIDNVI